MLLFKLGVYNLYSPVCGRVKRSVDDEDEDAPELVADHGKDVANLEGRMTKAEKNDDDVVIDKKRSNAPFCMQRQPSNFTV
ncbi:unnamed protein product [Linum trigynum]|uniref:Uncharacterized protein n=1 Tax=Linum trigynum TaxID=586398 RepID=A0AAV2EC53_9ROSI